MSRTYEHLAFVGVERNDFTSHAPCLLTDFKPHAYQRDCNVGTSAFQIGDDIDVGHVADKDVDFGIAICGTGIGISIACNKVKGVRCAKVDTKEEAIATRVDNDSNIIAFGEKMPLEKAVELITIFIETKASEEEKHVRRRQKIKEYEEEQC